MPRIPVLLVALFFTVGGIAHFAIMDKFISIMPAYIGYHKELVIISGVFELMGAIGILLPQTRRLAGYGLIALAIAVFPANINMALHPENYASISPLVLYIRLPLQLLIIWIIWLAMNPKEKART